MSLVKIHPTADVQSKKIGKDSTIWQYCIILPGAEIGENCNINAHCFIENDVVIGKNVTIKCGVYIWDGLQIEDNVFIGPNVSFTNDIYIRSKQRPENFLKTIIKKGASIGAGGVILAGITIGEYAMIGAGSVVTKNFPAYSLCYGNPAKFISYVCRCGQKLDRHLCCTVCPKKYRPKDNGIEEIRN